VHPALAPIGTEHELRLSPNILSVAHWSRLLGGALYAATTRVDWATLATPARTWGECQDGIWREVTLELN